MGKIFCMMGKSSSGKDTLFKLLLSDRELSFQTIIPYTTRPMRADETDGVEYFFCDEKRLERLSDEGRVIELRAYDTVHGVWKYFTVDDGQICLDRQDYLMIGTLEAYLKIKKYFGKENVVPIYIEVEDGLRLKRALKREAGQAHPEYEELCRRFLADAADFSEEKLKEAEIKVRFQNQDLACTQAEIKQYVMRQR